MESPPGREATEPSGLSSCPSFNSYSCDPLAGLLPHNCLHDKGEEEDHSVDDFEFAPVAGDVFDHGFMISSDQIGPVFPVFNRDLLLENGYGIDGRDSRGGVGGGGGDVRSIRIPLMNLFMEEDRDPQSTETDEELEGIPEGSYCVWAAREFPRSSPSWCKKSNSTGSRSSRRWRFLDLLRRSNSDRRESFVFLTPSSNGGAANLAKEARNSSGDSKSTTVGIAPERKATLASSSASRKPGSGLEMFYTRNRVAVKGGGGGSRRKSYLPYRQDLVGFLANVNSLGRTFPPFG
ncbi:hypothetical protein MLD38_034109 [Melastoma candidum]|uniref:Uncharacterized protein n=1 Tax=Melastoma candidum TaxID=119954 RepID=A0ACB9M8P3_9MYRT|nr:hypothetical protein MLD38_034109 [Melastoma candidum]